jgi:uncharacterized OB-fold protein
MAEYAKFLPPQDMPEFHRPFWDSIKAHAAKIQQCSGCRRFRFIPTEICAFCHNPHYEWAPISGSGEVYTYTVVHRAGTPAYQADAPYVIAHVTLPEGVRMSSNLIGIKPEEARIGMPVKLVYEDVTPDHTLYKFAPA